MKRYLAGVLLLGLILGFTSAAIAGGPKCPCFKSTDLEKLVKKGWVADILSNGETAKVILFRLPELPWDSSIKGKGLVKGYWWGTTDEGVVDVCSVEDSQTKWKEEYYSDNKYKRKTRPMPAGGEDSEECVRIMEDFIAGLPPM